MLHAPQRCRYWFNAWSGAKQFKYMMNFQYESFELSPVECIFFEGPAKFRVVDDTWESVPTCRVGLGQGIRRALPGAVERQVEDEPSPSFCMRECFPVF